MATIKCPNCFQENPSDNRFCMFCATPLHEEPAPSFSPAGSVTLRCPNGHPVNATDMITGFCSVCGQTLIPVESTEDKPAAAEPAPSYEPPVPAPAPEAEPAPAPTPFVVPYIDDAIEVTAKPDPAFAKPAAPAVAAIRVCSVCGTTVEDTLLTNCPRCGSSLDTAAAVTPAPAGWTCPGCGTLNNEEYSFCEACGTPRRAARSRRVSDDSAATTLLPGMRLPGDDDLLVRHKYGN